MQSQIVNSSLPFNYKIQAIQLHCKGKQRENLRNPLWRQFNCCCQFLAVV